MATSFPAPPVDGSGGYAELLVTDAIDVHKVRVHLAPFSIAGSVASPFNYPYSPSIAGSGETGVNDTLQALMDAIRIGYDSSWGLAVANLFQNVAGVLTPVYPVPQAAQVGNNGKAAVQGYDIARATVNTFSVHTTNPTGRTRFVLKLPAWGEHLDELNGSADTTGAIPGLPQLAQDNATGNIWQKVMHYLVGVNNGVRGHDGFRPQGIGKVSIDAHDRLRRRYGFA